MFNGYMGQENRWGLKSVNTTTTEEIYSNVPFLQQIQLIAMECIRLCEIGTPAVPITQGLTLHVAVKNHKHPDRLPHDFRAFDLNVSPIIGQGGIGWRRHSRILEESIGRPMDPGRPP